jgi:hypothetical protein
VNGVKVDGNPYVRLEVLPGTAAHKALRGRMPQRGELIAFSGPLIWDKDKRPPYFPLGHMEIHPHEPIGYPPQERAPFVC